MKRGKFTIALERKHHRERDWWNKWGHRRMSDVWAGGYRMRLVCVRCKNDWPCECDCSNTIQDKSGTHNV